MRRTIGLVAAVLVTLSFPGSSGAENLTNWFRCYPVRTDSVAAPGISFSGPLGVSASVPAQVVSGDVLTISNLVIDPGPSGLFMPDISQFKAVIGVDRAANDVVVSTPTGGTASVVITGQAGQTVSLSLKSMSWTQGNVWTSCYPYDPASPPGFATSEIVEPPPEGGPALPDPSVSVSDASVVEGAEGMNRPGNVAGSVP